MPQERKKKTSSKKSDSDRSSEAINENADASSEHATNPNHVVAESDTAPTNNEETTTIPMKPWTDAPGPSYSHTAVSDAQLERTISGAWGDKPKVGEKFDNRFEIVSLLGKGGMSSVYKARDMDMARVVAIKVLHPHLLEMEDSVKRFKREAQSIGGLKHDNIVDVHTFEVAQNGFPYIVMELLEGSSLSAVIEKEKRLSYERALPIFIQIADALVHAHRKGIIHRDLKPSNVLIGEKDHNDWVGIVDFGLAKFMPHARLDESSITTTGQIFGSPPYMSPEQCIGKNVDERSDIYSFGCLMYETLAGEPPLIAETPVATVMKQVSELPQPLSKTAPDAKIPPTLEALILKSLDKDPKNRQQSMAELMQELRSFLALEESGMEYKPVNTLVQARLLWTRNRSMLLSMIAVAVIAMVGFLYTLNEWINDSRRTAPFKVMFCVAISAAVLYGIWRIRSLDNRMKFPAIDGMVPKLSWLEKESETPEQPENEFERNTSEQLKLAGSLHSQQRFSEAQSLYDIHLLNEDPQDPLLAVHHGKLGDCYLNIGNYKLAEDKYLKAMNIAQRAGDKANSALAFIKYSFTCSKRWKAVETKRKFSEAVQTVKEEFGSDSPQHVAALSMYASQLWKEKRFVAALEASKQATAIKDQLPVPVESRSS